MKNRLLVMGILVMALALGMTVVGCDNGNGTTGGNGENGLDPKVEVSPSKIEIRNIQVYNEDGTPFSGNEIIDFATGQDIDAPRIYLEGKIENGLLSVTIPAPQASDLQAADLTDGITVNADGVKWFGFVCLVTKSWRVLADFVNDGLGYFIYVNKPCTLIEWDVSLQTGWNQVFETNDGLSTTPPINEESRWIIFEIDD